jgi:hypothetical protein
LLRSPEGKNNPMNGVIISVTNAVLVKKLLGL